MKKLITTLLIVALIIAGAYRYNSAQQTSNQDDTETTQDNTQNTTQETGNQTVTDTTEQTPQTSGETVVNEELLLQLESQKEVVISGEQVTQEDIKLIEDILKQLTEGVEQQ